jgi:hypothetical protein
MISSIGVAELRTGRLPPGKPSGVVLPGLGQTAPLMEPPQFLQAVVTGFAGHVVEGVPQEMHLVAKHGVCPPQIAGFVLLSGVKPEGEVLGKCHMGTGTTVAQVPEPHPRSGT